jgi:hypothetical protein
MACKIRPETKGFLMLRVFDHGFENASFANEENFLACFLLLFLYAREREMFAAEFCRPSLAFLTNQG